MQRKWLACLLVLSLASCDLSQLGSNDEPDVEAFRESLRDFNAETDVLADAVVELEAANADVNTLVEGEDRDALGEALRRQAEAIDQLETSAVRIEAIEGDISRATDGQALAWVPVLAFAALVAATARYAKERSDNALAAFERQGEAFENGDVEAAQREKEEIARNGLEVLNDTVTKIVNLMTKLPTNLPRIGSILLKEQANGQIANDTKVLSMTAACMQDPEAIDCRGAISQVAENSAGVVLPSPVTLIIVSPDNARLEVVEVDVAEPPEQTEVEVDPIPIEEATPESIASSDNNNGVNNGVNNGTTGPTNNGVNNGDGDTDGDGNPDATDNCPDVANEYQIDSDGDGIGNECDETACPESYTLDEDGCPPGEQWDRGVADCVQTQCPTGARYNSVKSCCCNCWDDKTTVNIHDPCRPGFLLFCGDAM